MSKTTDLTAGLRQRAAELLRQAEVIEREASGIDAGSLVLIPAWVAGCQYNHDGASPHPAVFFARTKSRPSQPGVDLAVTRDQFVPAKPGHYLRLCTAPRRLRDACEIVVPTIPAPTAGVFMVDDDRILTISEPPK